MTETSRTVLIIVRHLLFLRLIEPWIHKLLENGFRVEIGYTTINENTGVDDDAIKRIAGNAEISLAPLSQSIASKIILFLRLLQDFLRYLDPIYDDCPALRGRAATPIPWPIRKLFQLIGCRTEVVRWFFISLLRRLDNWLPCDSQVVNFLACKKYDVMLVTPLVDPSSGECEYLKCAQKRGDLTALIVASWDNLTNKGLIQFEPDMVFVWNRFVADEAMHLHRIPHEKLVITGAPAFDPWFNAHVSVSREVFCTELGLDPALPLIIYLGSSKFISKNEAESVCEWLEKLRKQSDERISQANVLVRPHPGNLQNWDCIKKFQRVAIWPPNGEQVVDSGTRGRYYDSLYHAAIVVAINTSGMIEAAILGRPVLMLSDARTHHTQEGTLHFRHLLNGGAVYPVASDSEHFQLLGKFLDGQDPDKEIRDKFVVEFVRPAGRDTEPAEIGVSALESLLANNV